MTKLIAKYLLLFSLVVAISGCKLAVVVVEGGEVQSTASGTCQPAVAGVTGTVCIHQVTDTSYSESFTAIPDPGWEFVKWNSGGGYFCADSTNPTCVISNVVLAGIPEVEALVASGETFYIMPVFTGLPGISISDTVTANGKLWAQVDLFMDVSIDEMNAVCPEGVCDGNLEGYDMTGWKWASVDDVKALFNFYIGSDELGPGVDFFADYSGSWGLAFFDDGWRPTASTGVSKSTTGNLYDSDDQLVGRLLWQFSNGSLRADVYSGSSGGGWFYLDNSP